MAEQQLVDYIKKAKQAGQTDEQTRSLLFKNGWTEDEVADAFSALAVQEQPQIQIQTQESQAQQPKIQQQAQQVQQIQQTQQIQQVQQPQQAQPQLQDKKILNSKNPITAIVVGLLVFIIIIVLSSVAYYIAGLYMNLPWNPFWPNPEATFNKAIIKSFDVKSGISENKISISLNNDQSIKASLVILSEQDISNINDLKIRTNIQLKEFSYPGVPKTAFDSIGIDLLMLGNKIYIKLSDSLIWESINPQLAELKGKWIKIDENSADALSTFESSISFTNTGRTAFNPELIKTIQNFISSEKIYTIEKQLSDENINGKTTYHYSVKLTKEKLAVLLNKILAEQFKSQQLAQEDSQNIAFAQNMLSVMTETVSNYIGDLSFDFWIGKSDSLIYKYKLAKSIDLSKFSVLTTQIPFETVYLTIETVNSNINKPVVIEEPKDSQKIENVIGPATKIIKINSYFKDIDNLAAQIFTINKSFYSLCKSTILTTILNDTTNQGATNISCYALRNSYCISAKLPDQSYICMSSKGVVGKAKCLSALSICQ
jgi:hypothetical protein